MGIDSARERIDRRVHELTAGAGVDLVVDLAGGPALPQLLTALRHRGRFVVVGAASGEFLAFTFLISSPRN